MRNDDGHLAPPLVNTHAYIRGLSSGSLIWSEKSVNLASVSKSILKRSCNAFRAIRHAFQAISSSASGSHKAAMVAGKELIRAVANKPIDQSVLDDTAKRIADVRATDEGKEGIQAFLEKRKPAWVQE